MKRRVIKLTALILLVSFLLGYGYRLFTKPSTVRAFGELTVDFGVPAGDPIFTINNMVPGNSTSKNVTVNNSGSVARMVAVKGLRTGGLGAVPQLENILNIVITDGLNPLYGTGSPTGPKTVQQFFTDSTTANGVQLGVVAAGSQTIYTFLVTLPTAAGNEYQQKSVIFDLTFGTITGNNVLINEVFYNVDSSHGFDSSVDTSSSGNPNFSIIGNGPGSINIINVNLNYTCSIIQTNASNLTNNITVSLNSGNNSVLGNLLGNTTITTGSTSANISVVNIGNFNIAKCKPNNNAGKNDEWIELFNPTEQTINLKNYKILDASGTAVTISGNQVLNPGAFALIAKDNSTWNAWSEPGSALKISLGAQIGNGLNNAGDRIILKNASNIEVDRMSWGTDTSGFTPPGTNPTVPAGSSTERLAPGFDNNAAGDWEQQTPPSPGT